jgi:acyl-[acyl-carrier-protein]-phospholipid O-acyltransferase/long-chain-fatty-acid--[acyl-carrier-protein] ligase
LAGKFSKERVRLGFVPMGAIGMGIFTMDLFFSGSLPRTLIDAGMMGLSAGFYVVPLNTLLQVQSPPQERGRVISTGNFLSFLAIIIASGFLWLAGGVLHMTPAQVFLVCGILSILVAGRCWYQLKKKDSGLTW